MKSYFYLFTRRLGLVLIFTSLTYCTLFSQGFSPQTEALLQKVIDSFANDPSYVGGLSVAIKVDDDLAFWQGAAGYAARNVDANNNLLPGGTPFTTATLSRAYSITKTFTAPLVLELAQEGYFRLEDPIIKFLPLMTAYNPGLNSSVTIRQLLAHESGYQDWEESMEIQQAVAFEPTHLWTVYELIALTRQIDPPGTVRRYSHNNYVFLGGIIEAATGKKAEDLFRERFFTPLHLTSMFLEGRETIGNRGTLAAPHDNISPFNPIFAFKGLPLFPDAYTNISSFPFDAITSIGFTGGGIVSNAADLAEWGSALFGGRITRPSTLQLLLNSISPTPDEFGNKLGYGLKNTPFISGEYNFIGHNGSAPGYRSLMFYQPEKKLTLVVLTNFGGVSPYVIAEALYKAIPDFLCGNENRKEDKIQLCVQGKTLCIPRQAASVFFKAQHWLSGNRSLFSPHFASFFNKKVAYLGACDAPKNKPWNRYAIAEKNHLEVNGNLSAAPNPFTDHTRLSFTVSQTGPVTFALYDLNGRLLTTLYKGVATKGTSQQVELKAGTLAAGIYIVQLQTAAGTSQQKIVLRK